MSEIGLRTPVGGIGGEFYISMGRFGSPFLKFDGMARWPRHIWTSIFTYGVVFVMFPILCWLAYAWVQGWLF